jgi:hypothetical protein
MKLLGNLLMTICLITGCLAAATAYRPRTSNDAIVGTTQTAPAGARDKTETELAKLRADLEAGRVTSEQYVRQREALVALVPPSPDGGVITEEARAQMIEQDADGQPVAQFVKVKEFSLTRWPYAWLFGLSALGLFTGAMLVRTATRHALEDSPISPGVEGAQKEGDPAYALAQTRAVAEQLLRDLPSMPSDRARLDAIVERLGEAQKTHLAAFVDARPRLIAKIGMGGYAELMDRFAAGERQINRAWSAAADGYLDEATRCLSNVPAMLAEAEKKL